MLENFRANVLKKLDEKKEKKKKANFFDGTSVISC